HLSIQYTTSPPLQCPSAIIILPPPPTPTLFPYTTLFRSHPTKIALINVPIPIAPPNKKATITRSTLMMARDFVTDQFSLLDKIIMERSIGFGAITDCK